MGRDEDGLATPSEPDDAPEAGKPEQKHESPAGESASAGEAVDHVAKEVDAEAIEPETTATVADGVEGIDIEPVRAEKEKASPPSSAADLAQAREVLGQILAAASIKAVVCIDDEYAKRPSSTDALNMLLTIPAEDRAKVAGLAALLGEKKFPGELPDEILAERFEKVWEGAPQGLQDRVHAGLLALSGQEHQLDETVAHVLKKLFNGRRLVEKSLKQWIKDRDQVLKEAPPSETLYLVDQDFSDEGGASDAGIQIIKDLQERFRGEPLFCGLLSHTFTPHEEHDNHIAFSDREHLDRSRFMLISKRRITEQIKGFALMLKLALLNPLCSLLNSEVARIIDDSIGEAKAALARMTIYEYEKIVFESSRREGVWEPDTMFRLFGMFQRRESRIAAKGDAQLETITGRIRAISNTSAHKLGAEPRHPYLIQRLEIYEEAAHLNAYHLPTELGDIYEMAPYRLFMLLAQPCDLMVRTVDGSRKETANEGFIAEVVPDRPRGPLGEPGYYELPYFREDGSTWFVNFRKWRSVKLWVLDLCVFNPDGEATLVLDSPCPPLLIPSWQKYHKRISDHVKPLVEALGPQGTLSGDLDASHGSKFPGVIPQVESVFPGQYLEGEKLLKFNCRRIVRLHTARATAALSGFFLYQSRPAFEHDFEERDNLPMQP